MSQILIALLLWILIISQGLAQNQVELGPGPLGVHIGGSETLKKFSPNSISTLVLRAQELGVRWIRAHITWKSLEPSPGNYDWSFLDPFIEQATNAGIELLLDIEGYPWNDTYGESSFDRTKLKPYENFITALVSRYRDRVQYWKIENEVLANNSGYGLARVNEFVEILSKADSVIKTLDPQAKVVLSGFGSSHLEKALADPLSEEYQAIKDFLQRTEELYDILDLHLYHNPETMDDKIDLVEGIFQQLGYQKPIWVGETAGPDLRFWDPDYDKDNDDDSEDFPPYQPPREIVQRVVVALSYGKARVQRVAWHKFFLRAKQDTVADNLNYAALLSSALEPTPLFSVFQLLISKLSGATIMENLNLHPQVASYHFINSNSGKDVYVLWSKGGDSFAIDLGIDVDSLLVTKATGEIPIENPHHLIVGPVPIFVEKRVVTSVMGGSSSPFSNFTLEQNYPNPFNPTTTIRFSLPKPEYVTLKVFDVLGNEIVTLVNREMMPGEHSVVFDAKDLPSGVYFYRLRAGIFIEQSKMVVIK